MSIPDVAPLLEGEPPHDQVVFATRLQRYWPDLLTGLTGAYPDHAPEMAYRHHPLVLEGELIRLHVGLEDPSDLIADLERGLAAFTAALTVP